jgi:hypothetical protein
MKEPINLYQVAELDEDEGSWFPFSDHLDFRGFELKLRFLNPRALDKLRKRCTRIRRGREDFDDDKFNRLVTEYSFIGFRGLTVSMLKKLMPLKCCRTDQGRELKDDQEIEFISENALFLKENSFDVRVFINERQTEWEEFYNQRKDEELKNSSTSVSGIKSAT